MKQYHIIGTVGETSIAPPSSYFDEAAKTFLSWVWESGKEEKSTLGQHSTPTKILTLLFLFFFFFCGATNVLST